MKLPTGFILYEGPSLLDGAPIVAIATLESSNVKTGNMIQTWILRQDVAPLDALKSGEDASICGDCKHRPALGGACYVDVSRAPSGVWKAYRRGRYPHAEAISSIGRGRMVRLGAYGDPMAVPARVWQLLIAGAAGHTGYTHQWRNAGLPIGQRAAINRMVMASADDPIEASTAREQGLRYFRIRLEGEPLAPREFTCPASEEGGFRRTCATCGACDGSKRPGAASVVIVVHGSKSGRYAAQRSQ
jgi:hypothetical protein